MINTDLNTYLNAGAALENAISTTNTVSGQLTTWDMNTGLTTTDITLPNTYTVNLGGTHTVYNNPYTYIQNKSLERYKYTERMVLAGVDVNKISKIIQLMNSEDPETVKMGEGLAEIEIKAKLLDDEGEQ